MGPLNAIYSWSSIKPLYSSIFSMNLAGILALTLLITWAIRFQRGFGDYLNLLTSGDGDAWPMMVVVAGVICTPAYILGIKTHFALKLEDDTVDANGVNRLLFLHALICLISGILVAILNAAYMARPSAFHQKTRNGLLEAIENYGNDIAVKERVDSMQTNLECCGDESYKDWFRVSWINPPMEDADEIDAGPQLEGQLTTEARMDDSASGNVPFSCCSNGILKPCVHFDLLKPSAVYNYDPKHLTIAVLGCRLKIVERAVLIKGYLIGYLVLLSIYQVVLSLLSRLLQTAHSNQMYIGPEQNSYHVWIFCKSEDPTVDKTMTRHKADKKLTSDRSTKQALVSSSTSSDNEEDLLLNNHRRRNRKESKFLKKISSKIAYVKRKGLPLFKTSSMKSRSHSEGKIIPVYSKDNLIPELPPTPPLPSVSIELEERERKASSKTASKDSQERTQMEIHSEVAGLIRNTGRQNRRKVLEKFVQISQATNQTRHGREHDGAEETSEEECSSRSERSRKRFHSVINPADAYDRFRGTLQHTLARREVMQYRNRRGIKTSSRVYRPKDRTHARIVAGGSKCVDTRITNLISKLRCNDVAPSYRLLANIQAGRRPIMKAPNVPPPPPPPPPPEFLNPSSTESRECNICHRPIQRTTRISRSRVSDPYDFVP